MHFKDNPEDICPHCGFDPKTYTIRAQELAPFTILNGKYILGRSLGSGGFGITYVAYDKDLEYPQAIKEFFMRSSMYRDSRTSTMVTLTVGNQSEDRIYKVNKERFKKEAQILARIGNIPGDRKSNV